MEENENTDKNYISLLEASKLCSYSEPYLRLRARTGKLKSIKLGKKWMTTARWIDDYSARVQEWREISEAKKRNLPQSVLVNAPRELSNNLEIESIPETQVIFADMPEMKAPETFYHPEAGLIQPPLPPKRLSSFSFGGQIFPVPEETPSNDVASYGWFGALLSGALCALLLFLVFGGGYIADIANIGAARFGQANIRQIVLNINDGGAQVAQMATAAKENFKNLSLDVISADSLNELVVAADRFFGGR